MDELARLYSAFASGSALEPIALMATTVLSALVVQLSHRRSKVKEHIGCLEKRLKLWKDSGLASLINEGRTLQLRLSKSNQAHHNQQLACSFANLMFVLSKEDTRSTGSSCQQSKRRCAPHT